MCPKTIIEGITIDGKEFRPSNWAERVSGQVKNKRVYFSPLLKPSQSNNGNKCLVLDHALKDTNPELYNHILNFAQKNQLQICDED